METSNLFLYGFIILVVIILIFFVLREVNCWYWKINEGIKFLREQAEETKRVRVLLENFFFYEDKAKEIKCSQCGKYYITTEMEDSECVFCGQENIKEI